MTPFTIIQATPSHIEQIAPLFDAYRVFYKQESDPEATKAFIRARLQNNESIVFLALGESNQALGFTQLYPSFDSISMARAWILYDLYVIPEARRNGVGKALLDRARHLGAETEASYLALDTAVDNFPAQALYESLGWERERDFHTYTLRLVKSD